MAALSKSGGLVTVQWQMGAKSAHGFEGNRVADKVIGIVLAAALWPSPVAMPGWALRPADSD